MDYKPKIGDEVYIDTWLFVTHGEDDFIGGLCKISGVKMSGDNLAIEVEEDPGSWYSWDYLKDMQVTLKKTFGINRGYKRPDNRPEFNEL